MNNAKEIVLSSLSSTSYLVVNKKLIYEYGANTAVFITNLIDKFKYYERKNQLKNNEWFFLTHENLINELNYTNRIIRSCKLKLRNNNIIETEMQGIPPKEYYKINWEALLGVLSTIGYVDVTNYGNGTVTNYGNVNVTNYGNGSVTNNNNNKSTINKGINNDTFLSKSILLKNNNKEKEASPQLFQKNIIEFSDFEYFWELYPKKTDKGKAQNSWKKLCGQKSRPKFSVIRKAIKEQIKTDRWKKGFIPLPTTWINQCRWLDDPAEMKDYSVKIETKNSGFVGKEPLKYKKPKEV